VADQIPNKFTSYSLSTEEERSGFMLTQSNTYVLRNELASIAEQKISVAVNSSDIQTFVQQEAYLRGKMDILEWLLAMSSQITNEEIADAQLLAAQQNETQLYPVSPHQNIFGN